jgi:hypothetical protein
MKENVLNEIREGNIRMRPRLYFVLRLGLLIVLAVMVLIVSSLVFSFILFTVSASGRLLLLGFGFQGLLAFVALFPWGLLVLDIVLLICLEQLIQRFRFGYRSPLLLLLSGLAVLSFAFAALINFTSFHDVIFKREQKHHMPVIGGLYRHAKRPPPERGIIRGFITSISTSTFTLTPAGYNTEDKTQFFTVILPPHTVLHNIVSIGDCLFVAGPREGTSTIRAFGLKKVVDCE